MSCIKTFSIIYCSGDCKSNSNDINGSISQETRQNKSNQSRQHYFKGSPSRRIAFKGRGRELEDMHLQKKRRIVLDLPTNTELKNLNHTNLFGMAGTEGKFTAVEV